MFRLSIELTIQPSCRELTDLIGCGGKWGGGELDGHDLAVWRGKTRCELGLAEDKPVIATGHQSLLWHPGILVKYLLVDALIKRHDFASANLVVDQHAGDYASFEVPVRRGDGSLSVRRVRLANVRADEPMGRHEPFSPEAAPTHLPLALPHIQQGIERIYAACRAHRDAPNAAVQMARALADLMKPWVCPIPHVTATDLVETSLARAIMRHMIDDPHRCAESYNRAVAAVPSAGIGSLLVRDDYVELPLWRIREDGRRMRAYDNDVQRVVEGDVEAPLLLPRALFMTALVRLGMCDLFVHGTGGANYDRAMEVWVKDWLGLQAAPIAVATATLRLDLAPPQGDLLDVEAATHAARRAWHNPETAGVAENSPGPTKRTLLARIEQSPPRSDIRRRQFRAMHRELESLRERHRDEVNSAAARAEQARRQARDLPIANRRDWPFPLYPDAVIDELAEAVNAKVNPCPAAP
ncbi:MAG: hypothetical protein JSV91_05195 [Phycisphaerales bacterium]|nr:MAG: hypothetical protein JSV91_05195 [Phycisphaerales bacterium]